jgi:positive regulator of sigma E activity
MRYSRKLYNALLLGVVAAMFVMPFVILLVGASLKMDYMGLAWSAVGCVVFCKALLCFIALTRSGKKRKAFESSKNK